MNAALYAFIVALHILICVILVLVVLLQQGKGDTGALMGGSSQTVFGSRGPTTFFHYLTGGAASLFLVTSMFLSCTPSPSKEAGSVLDDPEPAATATPGDDGTLDPAAPEGEELLDPPVSTGTGD